MPEAFQQSQMTSSGSVLLQHSLAVSRVLLIQIRFVIDQRPSGIFWHFLMLGKALPQVAAEAVV